jgi:DNA (cytosine-5)-methyltransferase 1
MFHGQWFSHGCKTILQETSHSKALYFLDTCDDNHISAIFKKCNVKILKPGDEEQPDDACYDANDFHCGQVILYFIKVIQLKYSFESLMYDEEHVSFFDLPDDALTVFDYKSCHSCNSRATEARVEKDFQTDTGVIHHGVHYHLDDFVFLHPTDQSKLLDIGQIINFEGKLPNMEVHIHYLGRYDDYVLKQKGVLEDLELALDEVR